jgi:large subunit ribosomal protein L5
MSRLRGLYKSKIVPAMRAKFNYTNVHAVPKLEKIVVSMGVGKAIQNRAIMDAAIKDIAMITSQKPLVCKAKKSVSNFKLRQGLEIGLKVTLRSERMYEFLDRLISLAIPRVRDFRGLNPNGFDGRGNYSLGLSEQGVFPEIVPGHIQFAQGMNITLVTTARTDQEGIELLRQFGMPFRQAQAG